MARFPYRPGASAKAIRGHIYWNRLYLQESQRGGKRGNYSGDAHLTARWLNVNANLNYFLCGWLKPVLDNEDLMTAKEAGHLCGALQEVNEVRETIASSWDYMSQANLNKYVTRIKRLILFVLKLTDKYDLFAQGEVRLLNYSYDSKEKDFVFIYADLSIDRRYFMGRPALRKLDEIRKLYRRSVTMLGQDFGKDYWAGVKPPAKKEHSNKKKKRKISSKPGATSRARGVVEEISPVGNVKFRYMDCKNQRRAVRSRMRLHLRRVYQPHVDHGKYPDFSDLIDNSVARALSLDEGKSFRVPVEHDGERLITFVFSR